jgi:hypothetical protein
MKSLFNEVDCNEMIGRIGKLSARDQPQWGKMSVGQMTAHVQMPLKVAIGEIRLKRGLLGILFGSVARKRYAGKASFTKNLPTDKHFVIKNQPDITEEKKNLTRILQRFQQLGPEGLSKEPHPIFGKMTSSEWDTIMWKHLDHHLRQFGA